MRNWSSRTRQKNWEGFMVRRFKPPAIRGCPSGETRACVSEFRKKRGIIEFGKTVC